MRIYTYKQNLMYGGKVARVIREADMNGAEMNDLLTCENPPDNLEDVDLYETFDCEYGWSPEECSYVEGTIEELRRETKLTLKDLNETPVNYNTWFCIEKYEAILEEIEELK